LPPTQGKTYQDSQRKHYKRQKPISMCVKHNHAPCSNVMVPNGAGARPPAHIYSIFMAKLLDDLSQARDER
jgi:hypothetical protein